MNINQVIPYRANEAFSGVVRGDGDAGHRKPEAANVEKFYFVVDGLRGNIFLGVSWSNSHSAITITG